MVQLMCTGALDRCLTPTGGERRRLVSILQQEACQLGLPSCFSISPYMHTQTTGWLQAPAAICTSFLAKLDTAVMLPSEAVL